MNNQDVLDELLWAIEAQEHNFALILARCNSISLRAKLTAELLSRCELSLEQITLEPNSSQVYHTIREYVGDRPCPGLMVFGLEEVKEIDSLLTGANQIREEFRTNCKFPIVWWINDFILPKVRRLAPDLETWTTTVEFELATEELIALIEQTTDQTFNKILNDGATRVLDNTTLNLGFGSVGRQELESAYQELKTRNVQLESCLEASLIFALTIGGEWEEQQTITKYEASLRQWEELKTRYDRGELEYFPLERLACVNYCLGVWWRDRGTHKSLDEKAAFTQARQYFQTCVALLEKAEQSMIASKFINALGDILEKLEDWPNLEKVGHQAVQLHQKFLNPFRLARAHNFLATAALGQEQWQEAYQYAQKALAISTSTEPDTEILAATQKPTIAWVRSYNQSAYYYSLAIAMRGLGLDNQALDSLQQARTKTEPYYEPELYIQILQALQSIYFKQGIYEEAFRLKQEIFSLEQQYNLRAFIGAGRLLPNQEIADTNVSGAGPHGSIAREIIASGRQQDVDKLLERIGRVDHKITIIYVQSGVGKTSIVQAGLIPALQAKPIGTRDVIAIITQVYTDWEQVLGQSLAETLDLPEINQDQEILEQLQHQVERNYTTVIIFDKFQEFFLTYPDLESRQKFYQFLKQCLDIPYIKIIFCLREDYIHNMLELNRLEVLEIINNNVLDKNIIYHLDNLSVSSAKTLIHELTRQAGIYPEAALVDRLVEELGNHSNQVRPIELQIVGAQLQAEKILTLAEYEERGPKNKLIQRYLQQVIRDCGPENEELATLTLFFLTDENNSRPLKTATELIKDIQNLMPQSTTNYQKSLALVLEILNQASLVSIVPDHPQCFYQLSQDYLVTFIRQQQNEELLNQLKIAQEEKQASDRKLNRLLQWSLIGSAAVGVIMTCLAIFAWQQAKDAEREELQAEQKELLALIKSSDALIASNNNFKALLESMKAAQSYYAINAKHDIHHHPKDDNVPSDNLEINVVSSLQKALLLVAESNTLSGHRSSVNAVEFSHDGNWIASASNDSTIKLWDRQGQDLKTFTGHQYGINTLDFSPDNNLLISGGTDMTLRLWNTRGDALKVIRGHLGPINTVAFSPNGRLIVSGGEDRTIKLWSEQGQPLKTISGHDRGVLKVKFSPDGKSFASVGRDGFVKLWNLDGQLMDTFGHGDGVYDQATDISFNPQKPELMAVSYDDGYIRIWHHTKKAIVTTIYTSKNNHINTLNFSQNGQLIFSGHWDKSIKVWRLDGSLVTTFYGHQSNIKDLALSPDGQTLASASGDQTVKLWQPFQSMEKTFHGHTGEVGAIAYIPTDQMSVSGGQDGNINFWNRDNSLFQSIPAHKNQISSFAFTQDQTTMASASEDGTIKIWIRKPNGEFRAIPRYTIFGHGKEGIQSVNFSPDGKYLVSGGDDYQINIWAVDSGKFVKSLTGHKLGITSVTFSADGQKIISTGLDQGINIWNLEGEIVKQLYDHHDAVNKVIFAPHSKQIVTVSADNTAKLWDENWQVITTFQGHQDTIVDAAISASGNIIATASYDGRIKIWNPTGKLLATLEGKAQRMKDLAFINEFELISGAEDGTITTWNLGNLIELKKLTNVGCNWLDNYLNNNINVTELERSICQQSWLSF